MKSPDELASRLARQWQNADLREQRLLRPESWPLTLTIGKPTGTVVRDQVGEVREHLQQWREVSIGQVHWQPVRFQSTSEAINIPTHWRLESPSQWVQATGSSEIKREYNTLNRLASALDPRFHSLIVRRRSLVMDKSEREVILSGEVALQLQPGCADGKPLRALSVAGTDSKFFERNRQLVTLMLDILFDGRASETGLETFLGAEDEGHHWLLIADLDGSLLPFSQMRVRAYELQSTPLPGQRLILVENERSLHQLPSAPDTIAVLGSGLNLSWLQASWLSNKAVAYWGDLDTWGLAMLGRAREHLPKLTPLLMDRTTFERFAAESAVEEPQAAPAIVPPGLTESEAGLYHLLLQSDRGRLEQEFLPVNMVHRAVVNWTARST
ncbi:Wadjet anti-phage system protein JetD domain-containing protein [Marinobacter sp.]|uniref:Wadjet anti-phage system protein JetD domain-containing protein n=1 Tax=Marinobacter sp. TaxID=50741 RepID=UPI0035688DAE